ncbi:C4-dicarboxylate ABC transporter substrate-binding protein [Pararhodobacter zhoushanensis]|uniref:C4-dicarboxylate ABC transporter substrate-binding protein n=1 Tax=Pararhodobacter zhoushanensis TaxID=2479545 RepID=UPI000F8D1B30|nr:C4-dicarboxylate ABC transporter substrate-binding protein [Pararhodobacter zhoushanensis]
MTMRLMTTPLALGSLILSSLPLAVAAPAMAAEVDGPAITWEVSLWGNRRGFTEGVEALAAYLAEKTDGNFQLSLQYGGVLSDPTENIDGIQIGAFEMATVCSFYHPGKLPVSTGLNLALLPLPTLESQYRTYAEYLRHPAVAAEWATWNAVPVMSVLMPNYEVMGRGEPPMDLAAWQGLRINASGGHAALMQALGAVSTTIPAPDLYSSMERGALDAIVYPYTYAFTAYSLQELSTWVTDSWNLGTVHCALAANADAYASLPQQYRDLIDEAIPAAYAHQIEAYSEVDATNEADFEARGLVRVPMPDDVRSALEAAVTPSWQAWVADMDSRGYPGQELLDLILTSAAAATAQ